MTSPLSGGTSPESTARRVDLPDPDGPMSSENSLGRSSRETSSRATTRLSPLPKLRVRFWAVSIFTVFSSLTQQCGGVGLAERAEGGGPRQEADRQREASNR